MNILCSRYALVRPTRWASAPEKTGSPPRAYAARWIKNQIFKFRETAGASRKFESVRVRGAKKEDAAIPEGRFGRASLQITGHGHYFSLKALECWPGSAITLREGRVIEDSRQTPIAQTVRLAFLTGVPQMCTTRGFRPALNEPAGWRAFSPGELLCRPIAKRDHK